MRQTPTLARVVEGLYSLERGKVVELGTHEELLTLGGRYQTMFEMQAAHFVEVDDAGEAVTYETL